MWHWWKSKSMGRLAMWEGPLSVLRIDSSVASAKSQSSELFQVVNSLMHPGREVVMEWCNWLAVFFAGHLGYPSGWPEVGHGQVCFLVSPPWSFSCFPYHQPGVSWRRGGGADITPVDELLLPWQISGGDDGFLLELMAPEMWGATRLSSLARAL